MKLHYKVEDIIADRILEDHAEEAWIFVNHNHEISEEYTRCLLNYSIAEYIKNNRWEEFLEFLGEEY